MSTEWDAAFKKLAHQRYPMETGQGLRSQSTAPDKTDKALTLVMRFCMGIALVCIVGFFNRVTRSGL